MLAFLLLQLQAPAPPAPGHWQQEVSYAIAARLDEARGVLAGTQAMRYTNRSPDTLTSIAFHLHLNAFRPHSRWSARDAAEGRRRFNDLQEPDYGFNHVANVVAMDAPLVAEYPYAPDSTIVRFRLPRPLPPGAGMTVTMDWDARPSTVPRRQGRRGRHYDFAHWYPKVVVYDRHGWNERPLEPAGEFYGEFGRYDVALDVAADQVMGATGLVACGDPGWQQPGAVPCADAVEPGRKLVRWRADDVHHFALSLDPEYRYEGGRHGATAIHVLYRPGDEQSWGGGVAVRRTAVAMAWLEELFGPFAWPQVTAVHRLDGGGTEFPMMMHNGSAGQGLILHELGHNFTMGILANNEWREGWLDEGFSDFAGAWFDEVQGAGDQFTPSESYMLENELDGHAEPAAWPAYAFRDFATYNDAIYTRGLLFFQRLRYVVGDDDMRRILRTFYARWRLRHVDEQAFRAVAEEVSGRDLGTLFAQALHDVVLYDYAVGRVTRREAGAGWVTEVEVRRLAEGMLPVEVLVLAEGDTALVRVEGALASEVVSVPTRTRPVEVRLDPRVRTGDWNMLNNRHRFGGDLLGAVLLFDAQRPARYTLDTWFSQPVERDRLVQSWMPMLWYNDAGGVTLGVRSRDNYLGRFERNQFWLSYATGEPDAAVRRLDFFVRARDPVWLRAPGFSPTFEAFRIEGRWGGLLEAAFTRTPHRGFGPSHRTALSLRLVAVDDPRFLDPGSYDAVGVVELALERETTLRTRGWSLVGRSGIAGGLTVDDDRLAAEGRARSTAYGRLWLEGIARRSLGPRWRMGLRGFAATTLADDDGAPRQRQFFAANADPFGQLNNPFLRSDGALMRGSDVAYHAPGGGNVRGADFRVAAPALLAVNGEVERVLRQRPRTGLFNRVTVAGFADVAQGLGTDRQRPDEAPLRFLADAGAGVRASHRIGDTTFQTRFDVPFYLSDPARSQNGFARDDPFAFRWTFSVQAAF